LTGIEKLTIARKLLLNELLSEIKEEYIDSERPFLKITFFQGLVLYIRSNDYGEYLYQFPQIITNLNFLVYKFVKYFEFDINTFILIYPIRYLITS